MKSSYKITTFKHTVSVWFGIIVMISLFVLAVAKLNEGIALSLAVLLLCGSLLILLLRQLFASFKNYVNISDQGIEVVHSYGKESFAWSDLQSVGLQALVMKRMGVMEAIPHLGISFNQPSGKLSNINSSKSIDLFKQESELSEFMGEPKQDLYINLRLLGDSDNGLKELLAKQTCYVKDLKPLIKTNSKDEFERIKENFK